MVWAESVLIWFKHALIPSPGAVPRADGDADALQRRPEPRRAEEVRHGGADPRRPNQPQDGEHGVTDSVYLGVFICTLFTCYLF